MFTLMLAVQMAVEVGAEFWGRTVPLKTDQGQMKAVATESHLVVEVKVTAAKGRPVRVTQQQFRLRLNGAKFPLPADTPGMAAAAIQYPDWDKDRGVEATAGPVTVGRPRPQARFPDDPHTRNVQGPDGLAEGKSLQEAMTGAAWSDGDVVAERSGLLFFPWKGKVAKIRTLELLWQGEGEERVVKLR